MKTVRTDRTKSRVAETFVIAKTEHGFRVCSPLTPAKQFIVTGIPDNPECTCENFVHPERPPDWQCEHILVVLNQPNGTGPMLQNETSRVESVNGNGTAEPPKNGRKRGPNGKNGKGSIMLLKRSVSPDGRIDSLSIEFSSPLGSMSDEEIIVHAGKTIAVQTAIAGGFLTANGSNGNGKSSHQNGETAVPNDAVAARMVGVSKINSRFGARPVLNVQVGAEVLKLFGSMKQLAEAVKAAGYDAVAQKLVEGMKFDLPCRVVTKPNGEYVNVDRVYPPENGSKG